MILNALKKKDFFFFIRVLLPFPSTNDISILLSNVFRVSRKSEFEFHIFSLINE